MWCLIPIIGPTFSLLIITGWTWVQIVCTATGSPIFAPAAMLLSLFAWGFAF